MPSLSTEDLIYLLDQRLKAQRLRTREFGNTLGRAGRRGAYILSGIDPLTATEMTQRQDPNAAYAAKLGDLEDTLADLEGRYFDAVKAMEEGDAAREEKAWDFMKQVVSTAGTLLQTSETTSRELGLAEKRAYGEVMKSMADTMVTVGNDIHVANDGTKVMNLGVKSKKEDFWEDSSRDAVKKYTEDVIAGGGDIKSVRFPSQLTAKLVEASDDMDPYEFYRMVHRISEREGGVDLVQAISEHQRAGLDKAKEGIDELRGVYGVMSRGYEAFTQKVEQFGRTEEALEKAELEMEEHGGGYGQAKGLAPVMKLATTAMGVMRGDLPYTAFFTGDILAAFGDELEAAGYDLKAMEQELSEPSRMEEHVDRLKGRMEEAEKDLDRYRERGPLLGSRELTDAIVADSRFQVFKDQHGIKDDQVALRLMDRMVRERRQATKASDSAAFAQAEYDEAITGSAPKADGLATPDSTPARPATQGENTTRAEGPATPEAKAEAARKKQKKTTADIGAFRTGRDSALKRDLTSGEADR